MLIEKKPSPEERQKLIYKTFAEILERDEAEIGDTTDFMHDLGGDSLQKLELIAKLEKRFRIRFTTQEAFSMNTVRSILDVLEKYDPPSAP